MNSSNQWKIMIVDDHDMVRAGLRTYLMLESKFDVVAEAANGAEALKLLRGLSAEERPDLILMDLMMPIMDGVEATGAIMKEFPEMKIVMLTSFLEDEKVVAAVEAGAVSYVLKTVSAEELIYAISGAVKGMPVMTADVS
ncbi:response regulator transcription factor, partial [Paenibacillus sepulcri]|nr:response regulator transcription factor [Paenibacillus sepulcri]